MSRRPPLAIVESAPASAERPAVDLQEAARIIGVSDRSIRRLLTKGELQGYRPLATKICIYRDSIESFQRRQPQTGGEPITTPGILPRRPGRVDHSAHRQAVEWLKAHGML